jgi:hypothetical protein
MGISDFVVSVAGLRRKLQALGAVLDDPAATEHERATAAALKARLEQRLRQAGVPEGDWTDKAFGLGRALRGLNQSTAPAAPKGNWTDHAFQAGRILRDGYKKFRPE